MSVFEHLIPDIESRIPPTDEQFPATDKLRMMFAKQVRKGHESMVEAMAGEDYDQFQWVAHDFKGIGALCGFGEISVFGEDCWKLAQRGAGWDELGGYVSALGVWIDKHQDELPTGEI